VREIAPAFQSGGKPPRSKTSQRSRLACPSFHQKRHAETRTLPHLNRRQDKPAGKAKDPENIGVFEVFSL
jgi:hypothetical protein